MPIIIKLLVLLAVCLLFGYSNSTATDGIALAENVASTDGADVISDNEDGFNAEENRQKRLNTEQIKESLEKIKTSLEKKIRDKLDKSPILGSIRNSPLLKGKSKLPSLLDSYKSSLGSQRISLLPPPCPYQPCSYQPCPPCPHQPLPTPETIPPNIASLGNVASIASAPVISTPSPTDEDSLGATHGPVVLPEYLMDKDTNKKKKPTNPNPITMQQLIETSNLRKEINYAVKHNTYVHSASEVKNMNNKVDADYDVPSTNAPPEQPQYFSDFFEPTTTPAPPPFQPFFQPFPSFDDFYSNFWSDWFRASKKFGASKKLGATLEQSLGSARSDFSYVPDEEPFVSPNEKIVNHLPSDNQNDNESVHGAATNDDEIAKMMAKSAEEMMQQGIVSNTVESYANSEEVPFIETNRVREELNITSVREDILFNIGENVIGWRTLQRNKHESHALIGITNTSILLVLETKGNYKLQVEKHLLSKPTFFITFTYWNETQQSINGIVIVSIQHELVFLRVNEAMNKMEIIWIWPTINIARYLHHMVLDTMDTLLIITDVHGGSAASIYRFDMNEKIFFLRQSLMLKTRALNMAFIQSGSDTFMCFPQKAHVVIYKYHKDHFRYFTQIESHNANILTAFEMGGHSYLTIGGSNAKILRYHRGTFQDQTILAKSWGDVEYFLPVPARTYRDDLILFVQHRMNYSSHTTAYLEALIWNGEAFHPALQVPCYINRQMSDLGLGCMLDEDRDLGIIGATTFTRNRSISIIVPRHQAPSGLFDLEIELLPAASTLNEHLLELLSEVMIMLDIRDQVLMEARQLIDNFPKEPMEPITITNKNIDTIRTHNLDLGTIVPTEGIFIGDELITPELVDEFFEVLNETETNLKLLEQMKRNKREGVQVIESLQLKSVNVTHLNVQYVNDIPAKDLVFVEDGNLKLDGTVVLEKPIKPAFVERLYSGSDQLLGQEVADTTIIKGDFNFEEINGLKWKDFINDIVLKHMPNSIDNMEILGDVIVEETATIEQLNGLLFPSQYVSTESTETIVVNARKMFKNTLITENLDCFGPINGILLSDAVTLSTAQHINGTTTFKHLEISDSLEFDPNATISGRRLDEFLENPTLKETNQIRSTVYIDTLEIDGPLYVRGTLNDVFLDDVLSDVVYKHETAPQINSFKRFESIEAPNIKLTTDLVNGRPFSSILTSDTPQTFNVSKLRASVYFQKLQLDGLFNFINVTQLDLNSIKLLGDQYTEAEFVFSEDDVLNIDANRLEVLETLNDIDVHDFIDIDEDFELNGNVHVNGLKVDELILDGEIKGSPDSLVNGFSLQHLVDTHFSKNHPQNISGSVYIPIAVLRGGVNTKYLNGYEFQEIVNTLKQLKTHEQLLNQSNIAVNQMIINGSVWFDDLVNGHDLEYIKANAIRLDQPNNIDIPIVFLDPIYANGNIQVDHMNEENFTTFVNDLVRKSADVTRVYGTTIFNEDVTIVNNAEFTTINEISVDRILTRNYNREIRNPIRIIGDVTIPNLVVKGELNGVSADDLNSYHYDVQSGTYVLNRDVYFNDSIEISYFNVNGGYQNIGNVNEHLKNIIRTDRLAVITGTKTFTDTVYFDKGFDVVDYNGINLQQTLENIVYIDQYQPVDIVSDVVFAAPVEIQNMQITGDLTTAKINQNSVIDWVLNTIRTDQPFNFDGTIIFSEGSFQSSNIITEYINGNRMDEVITLNTEQTFTKPVHFNYVYSSAPIVADGLVSGYNLPLERANTLMVYGTQYVDAQTIFPGIRVLNNLVTDGLINGRDLRLAAPLYEGNVVIDSPLSFGTFTADKLYTNDLISGINFDKWYETALVRYKSTPQVITAPWTIKTAVIDSMYAKEINGMDVNQYLQTLDQSQRQYQNDYQQKCQQAQNLIENTRKNEAFLSHFAKKFSIETQSLINSVYPVNFFDQNYFIVNSECQTLVHAWNGINKTYDQVSTAITGDVVQWIHILDPENQLFLISNNDGSVDSNCPISGAFIWRFNPQDMSLSQEVQFGRIGDIRSMAVKQNSRALFLAIRNNDGLWIEYNLRGAIVAEKNPPILTSSVRFVPAEAQLGLALSDGNHLSIVHECDSKRRTKRCGLLTEATAMHFTNRKNEHRQHFERSMEQLRTHLENGRTILQSILTSDELNRPNNNTAFSFFNQTKMEHMKELIQKSKERIAQILSRDKISSNSEFATERAVTTQKSHSVETSTSPITEQEQTEATTAQSDQHVTTQVPATDSVPVSSTLEQQNATQLNVDGKFIADLVSAIDKVMAANKSITSNISNDQLVESDSENVGATGTVLVDLMNLVDKVIEENEEKHRQENSDDANYENTYRTASQLNRTEIKQMLNDSLVVHELMSISNTTNQTDPHVGTLFGMFMLEKTFANTLDRASKAILGNDENEERNAADDDDDDAEDHHRRKSKGGLFGLLDPTRFNFATSLFKSIEGVRDSTNREVKNSDDEPTVGDEFGDIMFKLTPIADKLFDKIVYDLRQRNNALQYNSDPYTVGASHGSVAEKAENILKNNSQIAMSQAEMLLILEIMDGVDAAMIDSKIESINSSKIDEESVGSGAVLVNLIDLVDKIIEKNREKHRLDGNYENGDYDSFYYVESSLNRAELYQMLNDSLALHQTLSKSNSTEDNIPRVGTIFGALLMEKSLASKITQAIGEKTDASNSEMMNIEDNISTDTGIDSDSHVDPVDHILGMIAQAENITNAVNSNQTVDPSVGDEFGDIMFKLTPIADKIMDKVVDELRRRQYERDQNLLGASKEDDDDDDDMGKAFYSKMSGFFRKMSKSKVFRTVGNHLVKMYAFGKKHYPMARNMANQVENFYNTYLQNIAEDNQNDNLSYGAPEEYEVGSGRDKHKETKIKNLNSNKKQSDGHPHSVEDQRKLEILSKMLPNKQEFAQKFMVEMIKILANSSETSPNATFWPVIRKVVEATFDLRSNYSHGNVNETEANELIFKEFMSKLNETIEQEEKKSNASSEVMVGSVIGESTANEAKDQMGGSELENLFEKFTPLIDTLSDKVVAKIQKQIETKVQNLLKSSDKEHVKEKLEETTLPITTTTTSTTKFPLHHRPIIFGDDPEDFDLEKDLKEEDPNTESDCRRNITMKEFEQRLNEWKQLYGNTDSTIDLLRSAKDETQKPEFKSTKQLEATVVPIPNRSSPSQDTSEILAIRVGPNQQLLIAVPSITEHTIKSDHDRIQIFEDIVDGKLFQTISCYKPRGLVTFNMNTDTILAFIQDESEVKTYVFRGAQGFVEFTSFTAPSPIKQMIHNEIVTHPSQFLCPEHYLILVMGKQVDFMQTVAIGDCQFNGNINC